MGLSTYAHPAPRAMVLSPNARAQVHAPPPFSKVTPSEAALRPVARTTKSPSVMASSIPLPAWLMAEPSAAQIPVLLMSDAVTSVIAVRPSDRDSDGCRPGCSGLAVRPPMAGLHPAWLAPVDHGARPRR